jgi:hypothetical protein
MLKKIVLVAALTVASVVSVSVAARSQAHHSPAAPAAPALSLDWPGGSCNPWDVCASDSGNP